MMWAVGARYGYDTRTMRLRWLCFYFQGHGFMVDEEKRVQIETMNAAMGGG